MIGGAQFDEVMSAYGRFLESHPVPSNVVASLYRLESRADNRPKAAEWIPYLGRNSYAILFLYKEQYLIIRI